MKRNVQLRYACGFEGGKVPEAHNVSRFIKLLDIYPTETLKVFVSLKAAGKSPTEFAKISLQRNWLFKKILYREHMF
jgi:hypothetical protein